MYYTTETEFFLACIKVIYYHFLKHLRRVNSLTQTVILIYFLIRNPATVQRINWPLARKRIANDVDFLLFYNFSNCSPFEHPLWMKGDYDDNRRRQRQTLRESNNKIQRNLINVTAFPHLKLWRNAFQDIVLHVTTLFLFYRFITSYLLLLSL